MDSGKKDPLLFSPLMRVSSGGSPVSCGLSLHAWDGAHKGFTGEPYFFFSNFPRKTPFQMVVSEVPQLRKVKDAQPVLGDRMRDYLFFFPDLPASPIPYQSVSVRFFLLPSA